MNIGTIIDAAATGDPARAALIVDRRTITYAELTTAVEGCAAIIADATAAARGKGRAAGAVTRHRR
jgi:long-chain acyl-CoA synthetase